MTSMMRVDGSSNGISSKSSVTTIASELIGRNTSNNGRVDTLAITEQLAQLAQQNPTKAKAVYEEIQRHIAQHGSPLDHANLELDLKKELELLDPEIEKTVLGSVDETRRLQQSSKTITKTLNYSEIKDRIAKLRMEEDPMGTKRTVADALTIRMERMIVATAFELVDKQHIPLEDVARMMNMSTSELEEIIGHQDYLFSDGYDKSSQDSSSNAHEANNVQTQRKIDRDQSGISREKILNSLGDEANIAFEFKLKVGDIVISHKTETNGKGSELNFGVESDYFKASTDPSIATKIESGKAGFSTEVDTQNENKKLEVSYGFFSANTTSDGRAGVSASLNPIPKKYRVEDFDFDVSLSADFSVRRTVGEWILPTLEKNAETEQILKNLTGN